MNSELPFPSLLSSGAHKKMDPPAPTTVHTAPVPQGPLKARTTAQVVSASVDKKDNIEHSHGHGHSGHAHSGHAHEAHEHGKGHGTDHPHDEGHLSELFGWVTIPKISTGTMKRYLKLIWNGKDSSRLTIYLVAVFVTVSVNFMMGLFTFKASLLSGSFKLLFDTFCLTTALLAMVWARSRTCFDYSYGFARFETLGGFANSLFLFYTSFSVIIEALHGVYSPEEAISSIEFKLTAVSLFVNIIGLAMFHRNRHLEFYGHGTHGFIANSQGAHDNNMHGVFVHILGTAVIKLGVILMYLWSDSKENVVLMDFLTHMGTSIFMFRLGYPLFCRTGNIMLQTTPPEISDALEQCVRKINTSDGVLECRYKHWWSQSSSETVGSVHVRVRADADEQAILAMVTKQLKKYITNLTVQIEKDQNLLI